MLTGINLSVFSFICQTYIEHLTFLNVFLRDGGDVAQDRKGHCSLFYVPNNTVISGSKSFWNEEGYKERADWVSKVLD